MAFSPDGKTLATADGDGTARLWDVATHRQIGAPLTAGSDVVTAVAFSPDGKTLATGSYDGTARLWDVATHRQIGAPLTAASSGRDRGGLQPGRQDPGHRGAGRYGPAVGRRHPPPDRRAADRRHHVVAAVAFSPDGKTLATGSADGTARLWDVATHRQIGAPLTADSNGRDLGGLQPGRQDPGHRQRRRHGPAVGCRHPPADRRAADRRPAIVNCGGLQPGRQDPGHRSDDGTARLWDVATHQQIGAPLTAGSTAVDAVAFSPDGKTLATGSADGDGPAVGRRHLTGRSARR